MRTTRSSSRAANAAEVPTPASTLAAGTGAKRKPESQADAAKPKLKRARVAKAPSTPQAQASPQEATSSSSDNKETLTAASQEALVPAVLTFSFEDAKRHLISVDHRFEDLFSKMPCKPYEHLERVHPFRALVTSIVGQQISWLAARSVNHKFIRLYDASLPEKPDDYEAHRTPTSFFPTPEQVAKTDIPTLRSAGLSQRKAEYVLDLASRFADGRLSTEKLFNADDEELADMLIEVKGIGAWTVNMFAIFSLRRPDILPVGDLGVQRGLLIWFLSLHSTKHKWGFTPQKVAGASSAKKKTPKSKLASATTADPDELPAFGDAQTTSSSNVLDEDAPTPDISSVPPTTVLEDADDEIPSMPPAFTPSIRKTLDKPGVDEGSSPRPLPDGLTVAVLKSRLDGKKKIKGAFLTPKEMEDITESWKPYRSIATVANMSPELMDSPLSLPPSEPGYSSPIRGHPSPAESDTLKTPFFDIYESGKDGDARISEQRFASSSLPPLPQLFPPTSSPTAKSTGEELFPPIDYGSPMDLDFDEDRDTSFSGFQGHLGNPSSPSSPYGPAPVSIVLSNPSNLNAHPLKTGRIKPSKQVPLNVDATLHSPLFPPGHRLNPHFVRHYQLEDELGSGGYGFVMTAKHRMEGYEVAVKFIVKSKVPDHAWMEDESIGRLPTEVMLLSFIEHENIVKCLDLFEDSLYFYLIQELHGSPWPKAKRAHRASLPASASSTSLAPSTPSLSPSASTSSLPSSVGSSPSFPARELQQPISTPDIHTAIPLITIKASPEIAKPVPCPTYTRRPSHDLFECIEQSEHKRLSEKQARYVFSQVVDAVHYLESQGVTHRDIKDENLVIDRDLKVKLIDFGSAAVTDPNEPPPFYTQFYGTTAYASPEILLKKEYQAPPAEIWTLGVLLSYLLTGSSPFPTAKDAINGRIVLADMASAKISRTAMSLMKRCLDPNPRTRATIEEVKAHRWLA
ncbi:hypothetical protein DXG03_006716 [Asterophora parasitica]|uniref:Protein kinase domain-containing protein n=1 Tax=Asterophora parasitica TaxID=117018 RepID=A0A9P7GAK1_9AGAR|nr:hypothetical protein DXG03_006716 [Asterophora parasitica]